MGFKAKVEKVASSEKLLIRALTFSLSKPLYVCDES